MPAEIDTRAIDRLRNLKLPTRPMLAAGATEAAKAWREHFGAMPSESGFWQEEGANKVEVRDLTERSVSVVNTSRPVHAHYVGATIRPRTGRALAMPVTAEARRQWASLFPRRLRFVEILRGNVIGKLIERYSEGNAKRGIQGQTQYLLLRSTKLPRKGRTLFPPPSPTRRRVVGKMLAAWTRHWRRRSR